MRGAYSGFNHWLSTVSANQIHVWCYAHRLNLVICDCTKLIIEISSMFGLLNYCASFLRESYTRMNAWKDNTDTKKRINLIGDTRWWAKDLALNKIFGNFEDPTNSLYIELLMTMEAIQTSDVGNHSSNAYQAQNFITNLTSFETILMAKTFLRIFAITTPLSKYLQTVGLDILTAGRMVFVTLT